ncbi:hypothetical protein [Microbulbifer taiwanensis]|uniref:Penicillin-binding protein activator LpoB n=1 Tax=Microbulbifer taiwanensis TaxID=986746 RepID=A0ABW1YTS9_9GAMM|nr:hypothetical protein [Microbulbifer taiwanensis]
MTIRSRLLLAVPLLLCLCACSTQKVYRAQPLNEEAEWLLLPVVNLSQAPLAGERTESILVSQLRAEGVANLAEYPKNLPQQAIGLHSDQQRFEEARGWAGTQRARYWLTGTVDEWRYKAGLDGEPAIGLSLRVIDADTKAVLWSASGARTGWGREGVAVAMHRLIEDLIDDLPLEKE